MEEPWTLSKFLELFKCYTKIGMDQVNLIKSIQLPNLVQLWNMTQDSGLNKHVSGREPWSSGMGGDSCSKGREFESWHRILDGQFFRFISFNNCNLCLKKTKIN